MDDGMRKFIEDWEVESYRKGISAASRAVGRVAGKIAMVTGAAQGFGLEISQDLISQGATSCSRTSTPRARKRRRMDQRAAWQARALGLPINVTDTASVAEAIYQVVRSFGGFDVFISNAGVLKAGSVKTLPKRISISSRR
jgi:NAD(P)-dependent dehydrogenase (short-subunit alcohol dehydrogenase family)